jgi:Bacterial membrane protein YfhO
VSNLAAGLGILGLFAACAACAALIARWLGRPIPVGLLLLFALPSLLFVAPGLNGKAPLGPDQAFLSVPPPVITPPKSVWLNDVARQFVPWQEAIRAAWGEGSLPHRDRWNGCGTPLAANGQSAPYSPFTLLGLLLPPLGALSFFGALRLFLCLAGMWLWLTELSVSGRAATFGAVAFSFSMTMTPLLFFPLTGTISLWPWILFFIERLAGQSHRRAFVALTCGLALWPLTGHLESIASAGAFTALWLAARAVLGDRARVRRLVAPLGAAGVLALSLSAFTLLPQGLAIRASNRFALTERPYWAPHLSLRPHGQIWRHAAFLPFFPRLLGDGTSVPMIPGGAGAFPELALAYFGILPAACMLLVLRPGSQRPPSEWSLLAPLAFGFGAPIGLWPFGEIVSALPGLSRMFPLRYFTWFALAGAAISALELDRLERDLGRRRRVLLWPLATIGAILLLALLAYRNLRPLYAAAGALVAAQRPFLLAAGTLAAGLAVFVITARRPGQFRAWGIPLLTIIALAELFRQGTRLYGWADTRSLYTVTPLVDFLRSQPGPFRIAGREVTLFPNVNVLPRIEEVRTHDAAERRDYVEFLDATCGYDPVPYFKQIRNVDSPALDFLNVRYLVAGPDRTASSEKWKRVYSGPDGTVFENASPLPRVFAPETIRVVRRRAAGLLPEPATRAYGAPYRDLLRDLDWGREAVVLEDGTRGFHPTAQPPLTRADVTDYRETTNSVTFRARVRGGTGDAILITSLVQDGGWRARREDGGAIATGRANGPFLALQVPPGEHRLRLDYTAPGFRLGAWISVTTLALSGFLLAAARRRPVRSPRAS